MSCHRRKAGGLQKQVLYVENQWSIFLAFGESFEQFRVRPQRVPLLLALGDFGSKNMPSILFRPKPNVEKTPAAPKASPLCCGSLQLTNQID
jgi:hypothetical protein